MRITDAPDILRAAGLPVVVLPGFAARGVNMRQVVGVVEHCTVTPGGRNPLVVAHLLRDGHSTLRGPLSQLGHDDEGTWWCIAAGRSNHNGYGLWGNDAIGVEKMHPNTSAWPYYGMDSWVRGSAALAEAYHVPFVNVRAHRETDARRKTDPWGIDMDAFRRAVAHSRKVDDMTPEESARLARLEDKVDRIIEGVPAYGVPPLHETQLQISGVKEGPLHYLRETAQRELRRNVRKIGVKHGMVVRSRSRGDNHSGELADPDEEL